MGEYQASQRPGKLSRQEVADLFLRIAQGDTRAREEIICSHMYLVDILVDQHLGRGVDREDLYQDGCYGLIKAVDRFKPEKGASLATYATYWIERQIKSCLHSQNKNSQIVPYEKTFYRLQRYHAAVSHLQALLGRLPTDEEVAAHMDVPVQTIQALQQWVYTYISMDSESFHQDMPQVGYKRPTPQQCAVPSAEDTMLKSLCVLDLSSYGVELTDREEECLLRHLGITPTGESETFVAISASTGWGIETLRKDYYNALDKIRSAMIANGFYPGA